MKTIHKSILLFVFIFSINHLSGQENTIDPDQLLTSMVSEQNNIGVSAGYSIDGKTTWKNAKGHRNLEEKIPFETTTLTRLASIAKPMTAVAILQLVVILQLIWGYL